MGLYAELKRAKKKRGAFGVKRLRDKWRYPARLTMFRHLITS